MLRSGEHLLGRRLFDRRSEVREHWPPAQEASHKGCSPNVAEGPPAQEASHKECSPNVAEGPAAQEALGASHPT